MKRVLTLLLLTIFTTTPSLAVEVDLSSLSVEELIELRSDIETELNERGVSDPQMIYKGSYSVGDDIKAGSYVVTYDGGEVSAPIYITVFSNLESREQFASDVKNPPYKSDVNPLTIKFSKGDIGYISIENGNILILSHTFQIRPVDSESWRP